jgi:hypothetical protein
MQTASGRRQINWSPKNSNASNGQAGSGEGRRRRSFEARQDAMLTHDGKIAVPNRDPKTWRSQAKKRKQAIASAIVEPPKRSAIVESKRKRSSVFGDAPDLTEEELRGRGDAADALWRELVRRATPPEGE